MQHDDLKKRDRDLIGSFMRGQLDRRQFLKRLSLAGISATSASLLLNSLSTGALAASPFDWKKYKGKELKLLLNKHPYVDAMVKNLQNFQSLTDMKVTYDIFPEDVYFDKVTAALASRSTQYDAFMTGAYQTWKYGPARQIVDLNEFIKDPALTADTYAWDDILEQLRHSTAWDGKPGSQLGGPGSKQWAVPWGFELNSLSYNRVIFEKMKIKVPANLPEAIETAKKVTRDGKGVYGMGVRGSRSWATIHPGFLSAYTNYGGKDFVLKDGKLHAAMNTPESKKFHEMWVDMIREAGPKNWATYTWYEVGNDLGAGRSAMIYDADILGYFMNGGSNMEAGKLAYSAFTPNPAASAPTPNVWIWSLAMSNFSLNKPAAWYFIQWATGTLHTTFGAVKADLVNPVRKSVWDNKEFQDRLEKSYPGYLQQYQKSIGGSRIYFTPQQLFPEFTTEWASALQRMYAKQVPVSEGLDQLAALLDRKLRDAGV